MRSLITAALLLCSSLAQAQFEWQKTIICDETKAVFDYFEKGQHQERVVWRARDLVDPNLTHTMLANLKTGTWTMVQHDDRYACVLSAGTDFKVVDVGQKI